MQRLAAELKPPAPGARVRSAVGTYNKGVLNNGSHMVDLLHLLLGADDGPLRVIAGASAGGRPLARRPH